MTVVYQLCYITDRHALAPRELAAWMDAATSAEVDLIQIREKDLPTRELIDLAQGALDSARRHGGRTRIVINDRLDVALGLGAAGVHLSTRSLPARAVRAIVPPGFLVGASCHSLEEAREAEAGGADYIVLGPIFDTPSKHPFGPPLGLEKLRQVTAQLNIPIVALGGITGGASCRELTGFSPRSILISGYKFPLSGTTMKEPSNSSAAKRNCVKTIGIRALPQWLRIWMVGRALGIPACKQCGRDGRHKCDHGSNRILGSSGSHGAGVSSWQKVYADFLEPNE